MGRDCGEGRMTIRNKDNYMACLWDWGFLDACFGGTRIRITDVDGLVERRGHFLLIEAKSSGAPIPKGQAILFDALVKNTKWHVLVVWGATNKPEEAQFWGSKKFKANEAKVQEVVRRWYSMANRI